MNIWKKKKTRRGLSQWENDSGRFVYVSSTTNTRGEKVWVVDSNHPLYYINATYFDSRAKAMAHALDFMRRHDETSPGDIIFSQNVDLRTMNKL